MTGEKVGAGDQPEAVARSRTGLARPLGEYAAIYGASERTVKRWREIGGDAADEVPLDSPEEMLAWWTRNMKQRVPAGINQAVVQIRKAGRPSVALELPVMNAAAPPMPSEKAGPVEPEQPVTEEELGLDQTLRRLCEAEVRLSRKAQEPGQTKPWLDTVARMGTVAEKLREENERLGKLVPREWAEQAIHDFHRPVEREMRGLYRAMCDTLGLPPSPDREALWNAECDKLFSRFGEEVLRWR